MLRDRRPSTPVLLAATGLVAGGVLLTTPVTGAGAVVHVVVGLPFGLVLPGYLACRAAFPPGTVSPLERLCWTLASSVALLVLGALVLDATPLGIGAAGWVLLLSCALVAAGAVAHLRERGTTPPPARPRARPTPRAAALTATACLVAGGAIWLGVASEAAAGGPGFSQLWLLADDGPAGAAAAPAAARLGVHSYETAPTPFRVEVRAGGAPAGSWSFVLDPGQEWRASADVPRGVRVEADLFRDRDPAPYRRVWLGP